MGKVRCATGKVGSSWASSLATEVGPKGSVTTQIAMVTLPRVTSSFRSSTPGGTPSGSGAG